MKPRVTVLIAVLAACGDFKVDDHAANPTGAPAGTTTGLGSVGASISGIQFFGRLTSAATVVQGRLTFSAYDGDTRTLTIAVDAPGPGTFDAGGPYRPVATLTEVVGEAVRQWTSPTTTGFGSLTLTFLTEDTAVGSFFFSTVPDSATMAAGVTTRRNITVGTFNVAISR
jgi:hypothetical protein